jgi:hypothetical protein
MASALYK